MKSNADPVSQNQSNAIANSFADTNVGESKYNPNEHYNVTQLKKTIAGSSQIHKLRSIQSMADEAMSRQTVPKPGPVIQRVVEASGGLAKETVELGMAISNVFQYALKRCESVASTIKIIEDDSRVSSGSFGTFRHGELTVFIRSNQGIAELTHYSDERMIQSVKISNLAHELTHAADYVESKLDKTDVSTDYKSSEAGVFRTEWRAWAIEAATTFDLVKKGIPSDNQRKGLLASFQQGLGVAAKVKESVFYRLSKQYYDDHWESIDKTEFKFKRDQFDEFLQHRIIQTWMAEAQLIYILSVMGSSSGIIGKGAPNSVGGGGASNGGMGGGSSNSASAASGTSTFNGGGVKQYE